MRKVIASTFVTLDGFMVGPDEDMSWVLNDFNEEMENDIGDHLSNKTAAILLRQLLAKREK